MGLKIMLRLMKNLITEFLVGGTLNLGRKNKKKKRQGLKAGTIHHERRVKNDDFKNNLQ